MWNLGVFNEGRRVFVPIRIDLAASQYSADSEGQRSLLFLALNFEPGVAIRYQRIPLVQPDSRTCSNSSTSLLFMFTIGVINVVIAASTVLRRFLGRLRM